jgi:hypothetical protein
MRRRFDDPIPLPRGRQIVTLQDAARPSRRARVQIPNRKDPHSGRRKLAAGSAVPM